MSLIFTSGLLIDGLLHHWSKHELWLASKSNVLSQHAHVYRHAYFEGRKVRVEVKARWLLASERRCGNRIKPF